VRLLNHLKASNAKVAIATSTSRATFNKKLANKPHLQQLFQASVCGDEVGFFRLPGQHVSSASKGRYISAWSRSW
jgi:hypothetical protein